MSDEMKTNEYKKGQIDEMKNKRIIRNEVDEYFKKSSSPTEEVNNEIDIEVDKKGENNKETQNWKSDWTQSGTSKKYQQTHVVKRETSKNSEGFKGWNKTPRENNTWVNTRDKNRDNRNTSSEYKNRDNRNTSSEYKNRDNRNTSSEYKNRDNRNTNEYRNRDRRNTSGEYRSRDKQNFNRSQERRNLDRDVNSQERNKQERNNSQEINLVPTTVIITSEKGWKPRKYKTPETLEEKLDFNAKNGQSYLNKMTRTTFDRLSDKFVIIAKDDDNVPGTLKMLIDKIFEQALQQPSFCDLYADLCNNVNQEVLNFRNILLTKCQEEFERDKIIPEENLDINEKSRFTYKAKKRTLGNIKFIGELYKTNILVDPVIYECINKLLDQQTPLDPDEEKIEALSNLLINIGKSFDNEKTHHRLDKYFETINTLQSGSVTSRIRFMIQDLVDLRDRKWVPLRKK
jgi:hypothetical protein